MQGLTWECHFEQLETTEEFAGLKVARHEAVPDSLLVPDELLVPASDPVGFRLLRLMGWRDGQGVGPRRKRARALVDEDGDGDDGGQEDALLNDFKFVLSR